MRLLLAANNQATRRNEIIKSYLQLGSSSNRYAPRLPQQETKSSTKQLPPTGPILGPENILKTGFAQKGLPSTSKQTTTTPCRNESGEKLIKGETGGETWSNVRMTAVATAFRAHLESAQSSFPSILSSGTQLWWNYMVSLGESCSWIRPARSSVCCNEA